MNRNFSITKTIPIFILMSSLFLVGITSSQPAYDPWIDLNDDGFLNAKDAIILGAAFSASGTPINKTELLLELQAKIDIRAPTQGNISVSPAMFKPLASTDRVANWGDMLRIGGDEPSPIICVGGVQLPHRATITNVTVRWIDNGPDYVTFELFRAGPGPPPMGIAVVYSPGEEGGTIQPIYSYAHTIAESAKIVDNNNYFYYMWVTLPAYHVDYEYWFCGAFIEYEYIT